MNGLCAITEKDSVRGWSRDVGSTYGAEADGGGGGSNSNEFVCGGGGGGAASATAKAAAAAAADVTRTRRWFVVGVVRYAPTGWRQGPSGGAD